MKFDFDLVLNNLEGVPLKIIEDDKKESDMALHIPCSNALLSDFKPQQGEKLEEGRAKYIRRNLGKKIFNSGIVEITAEEVSMIKERVGKMYGAIIVGEVYDALENPIAEEVVDPESDPKAPVEKVETPAPAPGQ